MPVITVYRVITDNGYAEFRTQQAAQDYFNDTNGIEIEEELRDLPEEEE
jgi:hypothetical protein